MLMRLGIKVTAKKKNFPRNFLIIFHFFFLGDNMQQKHLHATSEFDVDWRRTLFESIIDCLF